MSPICQIGLSHMREQDLTRSLSASHSVPMDDATTKSILAVLERMAEWIQHDLVAKDAAIRARAEETLAAMIADALSKEASPPN